MKNYIDTYTKINISLSYLRDTFYYKKQFSNRMLKRNLVPLNRYFKYGGVDLVNYEYTSVRIIVVPSTYTGMKIKEGPRNDFEYNFEFNGLKISITANFNPNIMKRQYIWSIRAFGKIYNGTASENMEIREFSQRLKGRFTFNKYKSFNNKNNNSSNK